MEFLHRKGAVAHFGPHLAPPVNASLEILNLLFFFNLYKHASEGQVAALFRVKRLQPCGTAECYTLIAQDLAMYYICDYARYEFAMMFNIFMKHFLKQISLR